MTEPMVQLLLKAMFWFGVLVVVYAYMLYPVMIWVLAGLRREQRRSDSQYTTTRYSVVLAVHDEAARISGRLDELLTLVGTTDSCSEVIVVADGCTDATAALARSHQSPLVRVVELPENEGKARALSRGCELAQGDILVFADARQRWATASLRRLLENFDRPEVGAVTGELVIEAPEGLAGVGLYWRYEKWLRRNEGRLHSTVGVSGSISAVRRELFRPIPRGVLLDDVYWPLQVVMRGRRVVYEERAVAYDCLPDRRADEFRRKVRTLSGNFQLAAMLPQALLPWRNPIWVQFISHKLLRLAVPWMLLAVFLASALLDGPLYRIAFVAQVIFYGAALVALAGGPRSRWRMATAAAGFVMLNVAAWLAFWVWICGRTEGAWKKVAYDVSLPPD
jgi:cellulose synthase/poly-beta-1,6-N-acetylglucosamine synthase-like glycosyltransferase